MTRIVAPIGVQIEEDSVRVSAALESGTLIIDADGDWAITTESGAESDGSIAAALSEDGALVIQPGVAAGRLVIHETTSDTYLAV